MEIEQPSLISMFDNLDDQNAIRLDNFIVQLISNVSATVMGDSWSFVKDGHNVISRKSDENNGVICMNIVFSERLFSFSGNDVTFHSFKNFISALKIQDFTKGNIRLLRVEHKGYDSILIKNGRSSVYYRLSDRNKYSDKYGFDRQIDVQSMIADTSLPKMLCFSMSQNTIRTIYEKVSKMKISTISFSKKEKSVSFNFIADSDSMCEYAYDFSMDEVVEFSSTSITCDTKFSYSMFHIMRSIGTSVKVYIMGSKNRAVFVFTGTHKHGGDDIQIEVCGPSKY